MFKSTIVRRFTHTWIQDPGTEAQVLASGDSNDDGFSLPSGDTNRSSKIECSKYTAEARVQRRSSCHFGFRSNRLHQNMIIHWSCLFFLLTLVCVPVKCQGGESMPGTGFQ